ncbi:MAG TPA: FAD-dependent oxidoreductase [Longimicrobiales bacterium]
MANEQPAPSGPDLESGVALADLPEDEPFAGHVKGEPVLLVRRGAEVYAIGAVCTHYGAPLSEGLVVGDTIRCPWHHACFSLRTGEAMAAPALDPVACWSVEIRDGRVRVTDRSTHAPLSSRGRQADGPESVVIVGAGAAGTAAAEMLRREGYAGPITMVDPDANAPYDRPNLSKDYLAGTAPEEWIPLRPTGFHETHGIERIHSGAARLDAAGRTLVLTDGRSIRFGALLLATGAVPVRPGIDGAALPHVHTLRSLDDCRSIIRAAEHARRAVVLGAGFIGMEVAASLRQRGLDVTVVAPETVPFERVLGPDLGAMVRALHEAHGVAFRMGRTAARITADRVELDDGTAVPAELVVIGIGVRPDVTLAEQAGLAVGDGVRVDRYLGTSAPGIYAAGDIANWPGPVGGERIRIEHWAVAQRQGQTAARNILGRAEPFRSVPFFWTQQWGVPIAYVGHAARWTDTRVEGDPAAHDCTVRYLAGDRTLAVATVGRDRVSLEAEAALEAAFAADRAPDPALAAPGGLGGES